MKCPKCKKMVDRLICTLDKDKKDTYWACAICRKPAIHKNVYTGRRIWWGEEVYGKKYGSDELKADTESAMLGGDGSGLKG